MRPPIFKLVQESLIRLKRNAFMAALSGRNALQIVLFLLVGLSLHLSVPTTLGQEADQLSLHRWAVLHAEDTTSSRVAELVVFELGKIKKLQLVERQALKAVVTEQVLNNALSGSDAKDRVKLGAILQADAMLFVRHFGDKGHSQLEVSIADTHLGARLWHEYFPWDESKAEDIVKLVVASVGKVQQRFDKGITRVVGVPPFKSLNLLHDDDTLQTRYANLLTEALQSVPGVVVIELEEAKTLARERALAGRTTVDRFTPSFVEGSFRTTHAEGKASIVMLDVQVSNGQGKPRAIQAGTIALVDAPRWIAIDLVTHVLKDVQSAKPMPIEKQIEAITARADEFSSTGERRRASGLREAALLLDPSNVKQRLAVIEDYVGFFASYSILIPGTINDDLRALSSKMKFRAFMDSLSHFEYVIRNQKIKGELALDLAEKHRLVRDGYAYKFRSKSESFPPEEEAEAARRRFFSEVWPLTRFLERTSQSDHEYFNNWQDTFAKQALNHSELNSFLNQTEGLAFAKRLLTTVLPDRYAASASLCFLVQKPRWKSRRSSISRDEWRAFLTDLSRSSHTMARMYGRYGMLHDRLVDLPDDKAKATAWINEADQFLDDFIALPHAYELPKEGRSGRQYEHMYRLTLYRDKVAARIGLPPRPQMAIARPSKTTDTPGSKFPEALVPGGLVPDASIQTPLKPKTAPKLMASREVTGRSMGDSRIFTTKTSVVEPKRFPSFSNATFIERLGNGGVGVVITDRHVVRCGPKLDVFWNKAVLLFVHKRGQFHEVFLADRAAYMDVQWDGRHLWVATTNHGIFVLDSTGQVITQIQSPDIPPANRDIRLKPIGEGVAIAAGCFGPHARLWCAHIHLPTKKGTKASIKLIHEATEILTTNKPDPKLTFNKNLAAFPVWMHHARVSDSEEFVLIGRAISRMPRFTAPLRVDLPSLKVTVHPQAMLNGYYQPANTPQEAYHNRGTQLFEVSNDGMTVYDLTCKKPPQMLIQRPLSGQSKLIIPKGDWLYVPVTDDKWYRVNTSNLNVETFRVRLLKTHGRTNRGSSIGLSNHYGIIVMPPQAAHSCFPLANLP